MQEGDRGDEMYFVEAGEFAVLKRDDGGLNQEV
jgi:CRP-like cAMP-binding protein